MNELKLKEDKKTKGFFVEGTTRHTAASYAHIKRYISDGGPLSCPPIDTVGACRFSLKFKYKLQKPKAENSCIRVQFIDKEEGGGGDKCHWEGEPTSHLGANQQGPAHKNM